MGFLDWIRGIGGGENNNRLISEIMDEGLTGISRQLAGANENQRKKIPDNIIAFIGAAGGTDTSIIVSNTAYALTKRGLRVLIVDLNLMYPAVSGFFSVEPSVGRPDFVDFIVGKVEIGKSIKHILPALSVMYAHNRTLFDVLYADNKHTAEVWEDTMSKLSDLYDFVLIDVPNNLVLELVGETLNRADRVYIVWDENVSCPVNTERLRYCSEDGCGAYIGAKSRIVMNKRTQVYYTKEPFNKLGIRLVLEPFPFEPSVIESGLFGELYVQKGISTALNAKAFERLIYELADTLIQDAQGFARGNTAPATENSGTSAEKGVDNPV
ncbi:hypothetical protein AGMMS49975_23660 [Clostridia bacterium]|nr:hypothetical protein AGMMS49975_23660 [Clostridia bacterium]